MNIIYNKHFYFLLLFSGFSFVFYLLAIEIFECFINFNFVSFRWASALKMATNADKPDTAWYSTVQVLQDKFKLDQEKRGSRSFQQMATNFLEDPSDKEKRKSSIFDHVEETQKVMNKTNTLPRSFSAKDFSQENT